MVFYVLYYIQAKKFYYGENAGDIVGQLFHESESSSGARDTIEKLFNSKQIIISNEDSSGKRFKFDSFVLKSKKKPLPNENIAVEDEGGSVSLASCETRLARFCLASPLDGGGICGSK